ncbi:type VI secretion system tip protein VgrG [Enterobacterales bacterium CwR94]|nr:type VI secretion system tip protein VgrG [Enterobacterales bacterium CwR94]
MTGNPAPTFFNHSHHLLAVHDCAAVLDVLNFTGNEALSKPFTWRITFTSANHDLAREAMLLKGASLTLQPAAESQTYQPASEPLRVVQGVVTGFDVLGTSVDETRYAIMLQPRLALLARNRQNAIWQDMSVPQIVESILRDRHGMRGQDFLFSLNHEYPRREQVMQYNEDDLQFVSRLLAEVGIWFRFTTDLRLNIDVVEFYDGPQGYVSEVTLPAVPPSGLHDNGVESVWELVSRHSVVEKTVSTRDYNYRDATADMNAQADITGGDITTYGEAYHWADNYLSAGEAWSASPVIESGAFYARLRHERYLNQQTLLTAVSSCASLMAGSVVNVSGGAAVSETFRNGVVITALTCKAARDSSMETQFTAIPAQGRYSYRPALIARPVMAGTLPARVTSTTVNDSYGHIDRDGRYRVNMLFDRSDWETGFESLWVRQARPYAGDTYGLHLPLLAGTEVAIAFEQGNPDRPYIAGVLHDSAHGDHVTIRNYKRNVLRTPKNNKLRLDDTAGQEHIKLSTEYGGKSQLNLGHLVDSEKQKRGEGFELRTDSWGAIRAEKGLFISADGQPKAQGLQREMQAALQTLEAAQQTAAGLRHAAEAASAELADIAAQTTLMKEALEDLKAQALLMSAPAGIAQVTPASLQLSAGENLIATTGKNAEFSIAKRFSLAVGEVLSLFAHRMGIKMFASEGKVDIQAQSDALNLFAKQQLSIASSHDDVVLSARKAILLSCGGSFIRLSEAGIEMGTAKNVTVKCIAIQQQSAEQLKTALALSPGCKPGVIAAALEQSAVLKLG